MVIDLDLHVDFETFYDEKAGYSLKKMPTAQYVRDSRFKVEGVAIHCPQLGVRAYVEDPTDLFNSLPWHRIRLWAHNTQFDGLVLTEHYGHVPADYACTMFMARYMISQGLLDPRLQSSLEALAPTVGMEKLDMDAALAAGTLDVYALRDLDIHVALARLWLPQVPASEMGIMAQHIRMATEPVFDLAVSELQAIADKDKKLEELFPLVRKDALFTAALQGFGVAMEYKTTAKGNTKPALAKSDKFMQKLLDHDDERVRVLAETRISAKSTIHRSRAQRFIDVGSPLNAPILYYGAHCVPGDAEVLTPGGWERLDSWEGGDIAQWDPTGTVRFAPATRFVGPPVQAWLESTAPFAPGLFTPGHCIPRYPSVRRDFAPCAAEVAATKAQTVIPVGGALTLDEAPTLTPEQARVLVMVQADGYWDRDDVRIQVLKKRKIDRARRLLRKAGLDFYETTVPSQPGYVRFGVWRGRCPDWLTPERKQFGPWVMQQPYAVSRELVFWDGWEQGGKIHYCTTVRQSAEWAQTALHLSGWSANITTKTDKRGDRKPVFIVGVRERAHTFIYHKHWGVVAGQRRTYCARTETGYWLMRYKGHIQVTGNTGRGSGLDKLNLQNLPRKGGLRQCIRAPRFHKFVVVDSGQVEVRVNAWLSGQTDLLDDFRAGKDPYLSFAATLYGRDLAELIAAYEAEGDDGGAAHDQRQIGKAAVLALGFMQGAGGFLGYCEGYGIPMDPDLAARTVSTYRAKYTRIVARADAYLNEVRQTAAIQLPSGRRLTYPDLRANGRDVEYRRARIFAKSEHEGWSSIWRGQAIENAVQATARDAVFDQQLSLSRQGFRIALMVHDEVCILVEESKAEQALQAAEVAFSTSPTWAPDLPLVGEGRITDVYTK